MPGPPSVCCSFTRTRCPAARLRRRVRCQLVPALLNHPLAELSAHVHFMPGVPVRPMLAKPTTGVGEVLDKFGNSEFTCEYKYDGERVQVCDECGQCADAVCMRWRLWLLGLL